MDIRATSFSTLRSQPKSISLEHHNRSNNINKSSNFNPSTEIKSKSKFLSNLPISKTQQQLNNIFILAKKEAGAQAITTADEKGVLLYQQVEMNKTIPNGMELINRFHLKV